MPRVITDQGKRPAFSSNQGKRPVFSTNQGKRPVFSANQGKRSVFSTNQRQSQVISFCVFSRAYRCSVYMSEQFHCVFLGFWWRRDDDVLLVRYDITTVGTKNEGTTSADIKLAY